jgi:hypothetical protein
MKKTVLTICMMLVGFTAATAFGQTSGGVMGGQQQQHSGNVMVAQQSKDMMNGQKMNQEMRQNMAGMMKQMNETMQKMTNTIETKTVMESRNMLVIGKMMREMSVQMNEMAGNMEQGRIDPQTITKMQARMESVNQRIDAIQ